MTTAVEATGKILIMKTPEGEAPDWVRVQWVGVPLPCLPYYSLITDRIGTVTEEPEPDAVGFVVPQDRALEALEKKSPRAAQWWREHGFPAENKFFFFAKECAHIVSGVTQQEVLVATDMEMGFMELPGR